MKGNGYSVCTLLIAIKSAHLQIHLPAPATHTRLPFSAMKGTSATMLALSSALPIAAATAIREKKNCTATRSGVYTSHSRNASQSINQTGSAGEARAE